MPDVPLTLERDGAERLDSAAVPYLEALEAALADQPGDVAGIRLHGIPALSALLAPDGPIGRLVGRRLDAAAFPVRAILFDKTAASNWALAWHQDRTIAVAERREVPGYGPWTVKASLQHVMPPPDLLARMKTIRIHLDPVPEDNAPLLVVPGSHRSGRIAEQDISAIVDRCGTRACLADRGDIWLYSTPILHASDAARVPARRRVLQVDYAGEALPGGLRWLGV